MSTIKKGTIGFARQPGSDLQYQTDGSITGQIDYHFDWTANHNAAVSLIGSKHPDDPRVLLASARIRKDKVGKGVASYDCIGLQRDPTDRLVGYVPQTTTEPIETHPKFATIAGTSETPLNGAKFDEDTGEFLGFFGGEGLEGGPAADAEKKRGIRSYYSGSMIARATYYTYHPPRFSKFYTISQTLPNIPDISGVKNWLRMPATAEQVGTLWRVTEEFLGSGERGWDTDFYGT